MKYQHLLITTLILCLTISHLLGYTPLALSLTFLIASAIAYFLYAKDKAAARAGSWRVSENTLHLSALLFGWPGALIAQERLRHKTQKRRFRVVFWLSVLFNISGIVWLHSPQGNALLREGAFHLENVAIASVPHDVSVTAILFLTKFRTRNAEWFR